MNRHITHDRCGESLTPADLAQNFNYNVGAALTEAWKAGADETARRPLERAVEHLTRELERRKYEASRTQGAADRAVIHDPTAPKADDGLRERVEALADVEKAAKATYVANSYSDLHAALTETSAS